MGSLVSHVPYNIFQFYFKVNTRQILWYDFAKSEQHFNKHVSPQRFWCPQLMWPLLGSVQQKHHFLCIITNILLLRVIFLHHYYIFIFTVEYLQWFPFPTVQCTIEDHFNNSPYTFATSSADIAKRNSWTGTWMERSKYSPNGISI